MSSLAIAEGASIRQAGVDDVEDLRLLVGWSDRSHLRFQTSRLQQVVIGGGVWIVEQDQRLVGFAYATVDQPVTSIRGLVIRPGRQTGVVVETVMTRLVPAAESAGAMAISFIGDERWLTAHLERAGFVREGEIVGLHRPGSFLPVEGNRTCEVRTASLDDLDRIVAVDWSAFELPWRNGPQTIGEFLGQMPHFLVAEEKGELLGYVCGTSHGRAGHIVRLAVASGWQRRGVGARLMREILRKMAANGVRSLSLNTQRDNLQSQAFYRALGFSLTRRPTSVYRYSLQDR